MDDFIDRCADFDGYNDQQSADCALLMALYNEGIRAAAAFVPSAEYAYRSTPWYELEGTGGE